MSHGAANRPTAGRLEIASWCLYDFANSPFTTLVVTFIYSAFFAKVMVQDELWGTTVWTWAINISAILVALTTPVLGAVADRTRRKKRLLALTMLGSVGATAALALPTPGQALAAWLLFLVANTLYEVANVFYNSFLPALGPRERLGRISGYGWSLGYLGGLLCFLPALGMVGLEGEPGEYLLGPWITTADYWGVRATNLLVAVWFALFALPMFMFVREPAADRARVQAGKWTDGFRELAATFRDVRRYRHTFRFLLARLLYNDALVTIFTMAALYAQGTFRMETDELMLLGIWLNVVAGAGAFAMGFLDDYLGGKRTIALTLTLLLVAVAAAAIARNQTEFWLAATLVGLMVGPNQSASRSLMGRFVPSGKEGEFFGFFAFSGKATAWLGVFAFGTVTALTGSQRMAVLSVSLLLVVGLVVLLFVNEQEGRRQALDEAERRPPITD